MFILYNVSEKVSFKLEKNGKSLFKRINCFRSDNVEEIEETEHA